MKELKVSALEMPLRAQGGIPLTSDIKGTLQQAGIGRGRSKNPRWRGERRRDLAASISASIGWGR
jgi:hypothetical protein